MKLGVTSIPRTPGNFRPDVPSQDVRRQAGLSAMATELSEREKQSMRMGGAVSRAAMSLPAVSLLESNGIEPMKTASERNASVIVPIREVTYQLKSISY